MYRTLQIPTSAFLYPYPLVPVLYLLYLLCWALSQRRARQYRTEAEFEDEPVDIDADVVSVAGDTASVASEAAGKEEGDAGQNGDSQVLIGAAAADPAAAAIVPDVPSKAAPRSRRRTRRSAGVFERLKGLLFGVSTRSLGLNRFSLLANTLIMAFFLDSLLSPYIFPSHWEYNLRFFRTGGVSHRSAKVHVRYPFPFGAPLYEQLKDGSASSSGALPPYTEIDPALLFNPHPLRVIYREVMPVSTTPNAQLVLKEAARWERGPLLRLTPEADWTASATLSDLWPATEYEWTIAFAHNHTRPSQERTQRFTTFPDPRLPRASKFKPRQVLGSVLPPSPEEEEEDANPIDDPNHFTFATSSCVKPDFPWSPLQFSLWSWAVELFAPGKGARNQIAGFDLLAERTIDARRAAKRSFPSIRFFLQLGDLIYADVPFWQGWIGDGPKTSHYRKLYRNLFASESFRRVYERIPVIGIYDDHEAKNNWSGGSNDPAIQAAIPPATQAWKEYVGGANPANTAPEGKGEHWYTFRYGDTAFFVLDVRKHRAAAEQEDNEDKQVLGEAQKDALYQWLAATNTSSTTFKFVVSSVPFMSLWGGSLDVDGKKDSWAGYLTERDELLETMHYVPNVIVLSGDRHEFAAAGLSRRMEEKEQKQQQKQDGEEEGEPAQTSTDSYTQWPVTEFSTSPLNMFYLPVRTLSQAHGRGVTGQEKLLKYIPDGNVKWTEFEVDTRDAARPLVRAKVLVDGKVAWKLDVLGQPVVASKPAQAVGGLAKTLLEWLGIKRSWFA